MGASHFAGSVWYLFYYLGELILIANLFHLLSFTMWFILLSGHWGLDSSSPVSLYHFFFLGVAFLFIINCSSPAGAWLFSILVSLLLLFLATEGFSGMTKVGFLSNYNYVLYSLVFSSMGRFLIPSWNILVLAAYVWGYASMSTTIFYARLVSFSVLLTFAFFFPFLGISWDFIFFLSGVGLSVLYWESCASCCMAFV